MYRRCRGAALPRERTRTRRSALHGPAEKKTSASGAFLTQNEAKSANGVQELRAEVVVDFAAQMRKVNVDHVIKRCLAGGLLPHVASEHFTGDDTAFVQEQVLED